MKVEFLNLGIAKIILRFYLMMAVVILAGFTGAWWLAILALPIFMSTILGVHFSKEEEKGQRYHLPVKEEQQVA